jgi:hypothetical protein
MAFISVSNGNIMSFKIIGIHSIISYAYICFIFYIYINIIPLTSKFTVNLWKLELIDKKRTCNCEH